MIDSEEKMRRSQIVAELLSERQRQVDEEGWTPEHDDQHTAGELARAAACYAMPPRHRLSPWAWPFAAEWWKPGNDRRMLLKACALIIAEIERIDRAALRKGRAT